MTTGLFASGQRFLLVRRFRESIVPTAILVLGLGMIMYQISSAFLLFLDPINHLNLHITIALLLLFLVMIKEAKKGWPLAFLFLPLVLVVFVYVYCFAYDMQYRGGFPTLIDIIIGVIIVLLVVEATRQSFGIILPILGLLSILYLFICSRLPGTFRGPSLSFPVIISRIAVGMSEGVYGTLLGVSANYIFLFVVFGAALQATPAITFFMQVGKWASRYSRAGSALSAMLTSALMGTITGSPSANVATCGSFTIPLMKRMGYRPEQAGGIEAMASTGGQIMPPVMGAAAFVMSGFTGIPYIRICVMAIIPSLLYYFSGILYVHFQAGKLKLTSPGEKLDIKTLISTSPLFILSFVLLVILLVQGKSLSYSMSLTLALLFLMSFIYNVITRQSIRGFLSKFCNGLVQGAVIGAQIAASCALLGFLTAALQTGGLVITLPAAIQGLSGNSLPLLLILGALVSLLLGMGVTTTAVYILVAVFVSPVMMRMGISLAQAHFFPFFYGVVASITPPVATTALIASRMAGADYIKTGIEATKVGAASFIIPILMIYAPAILLITGDLRLDFLKVISSFVLIFSMQVLICNYCQTGTTIYERIGFSIVALAAIIGIFTNHFGILILTLVLFSISLCSQVLRTRRTKSVLKPQL